MNIALIGATGTIGQRILREALNRGHHVTAIVRDPSRLTASGGNLRVVQGDVLDPAGIAAGAAGADVVVSAHGPRNQPAESVVEAYRSLLQGVERSGVRRLLVVGGAGTLEVAPGQRLVDAPDFPESWKPVALAHADVLDLVKASGLDWTYFSPAALIQPGERTGKYRLGTDQLVVDAEGVSRISAEDYAAAMLDEIEHPQFVRRRFTAAY